MNLWSHYAASGYPGGYPGTFPYGRCYTKYLGSLPTLPATVCRPQTFDFNFTHSSLTPPITRAHYWKTSVIF